MLIGKRLAVSTVVGLALTAAVSIGYAAASPAGPAVPAPNGAVAAPAQPARALSTVNNPSPEQTVFVPVTPCRVVDTRHGGGAIVDSATRNFYVAGTANFPAQGGHSGGCGVPVGATAVAVNVTATQTQASGYLIGWAAGTARPVANFISTTRSGTISANPVLPLAATSSQQLSIYARGATQVVVDVSGYYVTQIHALIFASGTASQLYSGSPNVLSIANVGPGVADLTLDRDVTFCTPVAAADAQGHYALSFTFQGTNRIRVQTWTLNSSGTAIPTNGYVYVTVTC